MTFKKFLIATVLLITGLMMTGCAGMAISQGDDALKMKHYYDAARSYITALSYEPNNKDVKAKLASVAQPAYTEKLAVAQSYEGAADMEQAYTHYSDLAALIDNLNKYIGVSFSVINARQKVLELGNKISAGYYRAAEISFRNEDYYSAIEKYKKALNYTNPYKDSTEKLAESYYRMGKNYSYNGDYRQAAESFEKASQVIYNYRDSKRLAANNKAMADESDARLHYTSALELGGQGRYREAIKEFQVSLTYVPHYKNSEELIERYTRLINEKEAEEHYQKGLELMAGEHYKESKDEFKWVLSVFPEYKNAGKYAETCQRKLDELAASKNKDKENKEPVKDSANKENKDNAVKDKQAASDSVKKDNANTENISKDSSVKDNKDKEEKKD